MLAKLIMIINLLQASRRLLDDELTARLSDHREAFVRRRSSASSEADSTGTYERVFPLGSDYQEPPHLLRKSPEFQATENLGEAQETDPKPQSGCDDKDCCSIGQFQDNLHKASS